MRKNFVLEKFHLEIDSHINLAGKFVENEILPFILKSCRMKPRKMVENKTAFSQRKNLTLQKEWIDEWGNSLKLEKNKNVQKRIEIVIDDLSLNLEDLSCTDLFFGLSMEKVQKMSQWVMIHAGIDEDFLEPCFFFNFLGLDGFFRSFVFFGGEWKKVSALMMGESGFRNFTRVREKIEKGESSFFQIHQAPEKSMPVPCVRVDQWLSSLPVQEEFLDQLKKAGHWSLVEILKEDGE